jgi:hypothetical protein
LLGYTNSSDDVKKCQQAFLAPLPGIGFVSILSNDVKKCQQLLGGYGENKGLLSFIILLQLAMFLFFTYSCAIELEYSFYVIILTYELAYSLCVMILTCPYDMILVCELVHSPYARVSSYKTLCIIIHTICLLGFRVRYRWWFIMPSGTPKSFTCRSVGSGTAGDLGGHYI